MQEKKDAKDSSQLQEFNTGAVRCKLEERWDLITPIGLRRVAETCHEGMVKYGAFNWEKGMPIGDLLNHAIKHAYMYLSGDRSEDHLGHAAWGFLAACHMEELRQDLDHQLRSAPLVRVAPKQEATKQAHSCDIPGCAVCDPIPHVEREEVGGVEIKCNCAAQNNDITLHHAGWCQLAIYKRG